MTVLDTGASKDVFITGMAGFLGSHLADAFVEAGHDVAGNDNFSGGYASNVPEEAEFHHVDCKDVWEMKEAVAEADIVYHTAALAYEGLSVFSPARINRSIYQSTTATLAAAADADVERFVYCSSMSRYGENETPFTEDMEPQPQDPYAVSKVAAEEMVELMADVHGFEYVVAVPHNIIGPRQRYDDPFRNVAAIFINIGPDDEFVTINHLAETIADILDFDLDPIYKPDRPQEVKLANCSADKARELLDYETEYTLREGLEEMVDWIEEQGTKEFDYHIECEIVNERTPDTWTNELI